MEYSETRKFLDQISIKKKKAEQNRPASTKFSEKTWVSQADHNNN